MDQSPPSSGPPGMGSPPLPGELGRSPGVVQHDVYTATAAERMREAKPTEAPKKPSPWNAPAFVLLGIALTVVFLVVWPQFRARSIENHAKPLVTALAGRPAGVACPRYLTSVVMEVGSVSLDNKGNISDTTHLTGPTCSALKHLFSTGGRAELQCLDANPDKCTDNAIRSVVAIAVVTHESMHIRGILDEAQAECSSMAQSPVLAQTLQLSPAQATMVSWLHFEALNPFTPDRYQISPESCPQLAQLITEMPPQSSAIEVLALRTSRMWQKMAS